MGQNVNNKIWFGFGTFINVNNVQRDPIENSKLIYIFFHFLVTTNSKIKHLNHKFF